MRLLVEAGADVRAKTDDGRLAGELLKCELNQALTKQAIELLQYKPGSEEEEEQVGEGLSFISCMSFT
jgi:hypothetical protein